jgi:hypothetical protein
MGLFDEAASMDKAATVGDATVSWIRLRRAARITLSLLLK